jgi:hypothetical protein
MEYNPEEDGATTASTNFSLLGAGNQHWEVKSPTWRGMLLSSLSLSCGGEGEGGGGLPRRAEFQQMMDALECKIMNVWVVWKQAPSGMYSKQFDGGGCPWSSHHLGVCLVPTLVINAILAMDN